MGVFQAISLYLRSGIILASSLFKIQALLLFLLFFFFKENQEINFHVFFCLE